MTARRFNAGARAGESDLLVRHDERRVPCGGRLGGEGDGEEDGEEGSRRRHGEDGWDGIDNQCC